MEVATWHLNFEGPFNLGVQKDEDDIEPLSSFFPQISSKLRATFNSLSGLIELSNISGKVTFSLQGK